jgi:hypothetical protein
MPHDATFAAYAFLRQSGVLTAANAATPHLRRTTTEYGPKGPYLRISEIA